MKQAVRWTQCRAVQEAEGEQAQRQRAGGRLLQTRRAEYITVGCLGRRLARAGAYLDYLVYSFSNQELWLGVWMLWRLQETPCST